MAIDVTLITLDEQGIRYLQDTIASLNLVAQQQNEEIIELRNRIANAERERFLIGRAVGDIDAATETASKWTPGIGEIELYSPRTGLDGPEYEKIPDIGLREVLNFTCDPIYNECFPIRVDRIDDTGQLCILENPADQYLAKALEEIPFSSTGDFEITACDGLPRTISDVLAQFDVQIDDVVPIFKLSPHDCQWSTLKVESGGVGTLKATAPGGDLDCPGGPTLLEVEQLVFDADKGQKCYEPCLDELLQQIEVEVWNQCDSIPAGTRVQYKRVKGGFMIDVECCPDEPTPAPVGEGMTDLGVFGVPVQF